MDKMSFPEWLEEVIGISWQEFDDSYSGEMIEQIFVEYDEYWES